ncbi:MAG: hypothetical protein ACI8PT_001937 [Gammaproteobacteria bacterium]|jgi:hypothetical protein
MTQTIPTAFTATTLAELGGKFWLAGYCEKCFHSADIAHTSLPPSTVLEALKRRLRCSQCGSRQVLLYRGWEAGGFHVGYDSVPEGKVD